MKNGLIGERPQEVKKVLHLSFAILGLELINLFWQKGYSHPYSLLVFITVTGFLGFLMWGIWNGKNWIRLVWIIVSLIGIPVTLLTLSTKSMPREMRIIYSIQFVFSLLILYHLMKRDFANWFKRMGKPRLANLGSHFQEIGGDREENKQRKLIDDNNKREEDEKGEAERLKNGEKSQGNIWVDPYLGLEFVFIKGGSFEMSDIWDGEDSDKKPVYEVYVDGFWMGKLLVTQGQWKKLMDHNPSTFKKGDNYPVEHVSWNDVQEFIRKLNQNTQLNFRLPTEEEWEYSARSGGKKEKWAGTDEESELIEFAWYNLNSGGETHPVGQKKSNGLGLFDMSGNVWEWVQKDYGVEEQEKVIRGGSSCNGPTFLRTSTRAFITSDYKVSFIGFRLVLPVK